MYKKKYLKYKSKYLNLKNKLYGGCEVSRELTEEKEEGRTLEEVEDNLEAAAAADGKGASGQPAAAEEEEGRTLTEEQIEDPWHALLGKLTATSTPLPPLVRNWRREDFEKGKKELQPSQPTKPRPPNMKTYSGKRQQCRNIHEQNLLEKEEAKKKQEKIKIKRRHSVRHLTKIWISQLY